MSFNFGSSGFDNVNPAAASDASFAASYQSRSNPAENALYDFLGMPTRRMPIDTNSMRPRVNQVGADAYEGRFAFLSDTIEGFVLYDNEPYTLIFLPWVFTDEKNFTFNTIVFDKALPGPTPFEGTSRLVTSHTKSQSFTSQRHGIKFRMEGNFANTAQGRAAYRRNVIQLTQSIQELANHGCEMELLNCKRYSRELTQQWKERNITWRKVLIGECETFAAACRPGNILEKMIEENKKVLDLRRLTADTLLLWPGGKIFLTMESMGARTEYLSYGAQGQVIFNEGPRAAGILRGLVVFEGREFDVDSDGPAVLPLERVVEVGECYPMTFGTRRSEVLKNYATEQRDIFIYSLNADDYKRVSFEKAFLHCGMFEGRAAGYAPDRIFASKCNAMNANIRYYDDEFARYSNDYALMDSMHGEEGVSRTQAMMIAHHIGETANNNAFFVPRVLGQFDLDVINTNDFKQMAQSVLNSGNAQQILNQLASVSVVDTNGATGLAVQSTSTEVVREDGTKGYGSLYGSRSPAALVNVTGSAGLLFSALPASDTAETMLYGKVQGNKLTAAPEKNRLNAWLKKIQETASKSKKDDASYKRAIHQRNKVVMNINSALERANKKNTATVRDQLRAALEKNVTSSGTYETGASFESLKDAIMSVMSNASQAPNSSKVIESSVLHKATDDFCVNPLATKAKLSQLSEEQADAVAQALGDHTVALNDLEERAILHNASEKIDSSNAVQWAESLGSNAESKATLKVAKAYAKTHEALCAAVNSIMPAAAAKGAAAASKWRSSTNASGLATTGADLDFLASNPDFMSGDRNMYEVDASGGGGEGGDGYLVGSDIGGLARGAYAYRLSKGASMANDLGTVYAAMLNVQNTRTAWLKLIELGVHVPCNLLLWRLWIRNHMYTAVMFRSGIETGGTIYGHANMATAGEVTTKTIEAHLTFNYASIVWNPKAVIHLNNVCPRGHLGGWNTKFLRGPQEVYEAAEEKRGSIISTMVPITENTWEFPINFVPTQKYINSESGSAEFYADKVELYGTYSSAAFYEKLWGLEDSVQFSESYDRYSDEYRVANTIAYQGAHYCYSKSGGFKTFKHGNGHLSGNRTGPGARAVWEATRTLFPEQHPERATLV